MVKGSAFGPESRARSLLAAGLLTLSALTGCGADELEVDVVIGRHHRTDGDTDVLLIYPRFAGECSCMKFRGTPAGCSEAGISDIGFECECAAECFEWARVERAGRVLGRTNPEIDYLPASFQVSELIEDGDVLVVSACGAERRIPLLGNDLEALRTGTIEQRGDEFGLHWEPDSDAGYSTVSFGMGLLQKGCSTTETEQWFDRAASDLPPQDELPRFTSLNLGQVQALPVVHAELTRARRFIQEDIRTDFTLPRFVGEGRYEVAHPEYAFRISSGSIDQVWFQVLDDGGVSLEVRTGGMALSTGPGFARVAVGDAVVELPAVPLDPLFGAPFDAPFEGSIDYGTFRYPSPNQPESMIEQRLVLLYEPPFAMPVR